MDAPLIANEGAIRLGVFVGVLAAMALWEVLAPKRRPGLGKPARWGRNLGVAVLNSVVVRLLFPVLALAMAGIAEEQGFGLMNAHPLPGWLALVLGVLILDLAIYLQHVLFHAVPALWRLHMMHHADLDFDVTTGIRFHPVEIVLSMFIKLLVVAAIGPPALAVLVFEVLLNATAMFNHGNVRLPPALDRRLRLLVVTPDMHRVHHSVLPAETNSNFGFNLPWWDRLFGTYRDQPAAGHEGMTIGLGHLRDPARLTFIGMLALPFAGTTGDYPIGRRGGGSEGS